MPRISLYRPEKTKDYKFLDRIIKEQLVAGGTDLYIHKYLGSNNPTNSTDNTLPHYDSLDPTNIQDLLFLENRDRKYDPNIYRIRGHYNVQNLDFDLSQFGLFLNNDIIFITVHYNEMIDLIGRKLMVGDVFELPHLTDYHPLNETIPVGLRRYYQITDANFASEGFSQTWYPHLWRIKCEPLVDSQEFSNILNQPINQENYLGDWDPTKTYIPGYTVTYGDKNYTPLAPGPVPAGIAPTDTNYWQLDTADNLRDIIGRYNKNIEINNAVIEEAARIVPKAGYDRSQLYLVPTYENNQPAPPVNVIVTPGNPEPIRAEVFMVTNPLYRVPSPVLRVGAEARKRLEKLTSEETDALRKFVNLSLSTGKLAPERTENGSGQVDGTLVLTAKSMGDITGPYGTADNTYSTADNFPSFQLTSLEVPLGSTIIPCQAFDASQDPWPEVDVAANLTTENGTLLPVFPPDTRIVNVDFVNSIITVNNPTIQLMPAGTAIQVAPSFMYSVTQQMDFRADCDPRFTFIARVSPRDFGYTNGYMIGDGSAPNGLPVGSGITFPVNPSVGDYFLRVDYLPNLLYRWDGALWVRIGVSNRAGVAFDSTIPSEQNQLASFINNEQTLVLTDGTVVPSQQPLSTLFSIVPD